MSGSVLSRVRARVDSGYPTPELDDIRVMLAALDQVLEQHSPAFDDDSYKWCSECWQSWPCRTVAALRSVLGDASNG